MGLQNTEGKAQEAIIKYTLDFSDNINNMMKDDFFFVCITALSMGPIFY
jgi:hypothetical protein